MSKILLVSILIVTVVVPLYAAKDPRPKRGLKKALRYMKLFLVVWVFFCAYLYTYVLAAGG